jgi:hypothetical protein
MQKNRKKFNKHQRNQAEYGLKKHISQMTELEQEFLMRRFHEVPQQEWSFTSYSKQRFNERGIDAEHFLSLWEQDVELIEYHFKHNSNRILLRSKAVHNDANVCAVFSIEQRKIVTVYLNYKENNHERLRLEFYNKDLDILETYKGGK